MNEENYRREVEKATVRITYTEPSPRPEPEEEPKPTVQEECGRKEDKDDNGE